MTHNQQADHRFHVGRSIRRVRLSYGHTLEKVAKDAGISFSHLSQVERGRSEPSLTTLQKIAKVFGVPMFRFLVPDGREQLVVRRNERKRLSFPDSHIDFELLTPNVQCNMEILLGRLQPGASNTEKPWSHVCEECNIVLRGKMEVLLGDRSYTLQEGDSIYFNSTIPHIIRNVGRKALVFICASSPPVF
jgi:transcriptional regulator with XRE-family HTH domain